jgi:hypothetical protein
MDWEGDRRVENITRDDLEERLREIACHHHPEEVLDRMELVHLVQVVTNEALVLTDLYARVSLGEILQRRVPALPPALRALVERTTRDEEPRLLFEVKQLPDRIKAVGDKCLFDVGLIGQSEYHGIPLDELGPRSYQVASQVLARLAEDPRLEQYFRENCLRTLPIEKEVVFLQQCSRRFALYADLLRWLRADAPASVTGGRRKDAPEDGSSVPEDRPSARGATVPASRAAGSADLSGGAAAGAREEAGGVLVAAFPSSRPEPPREKLLLSRDELLAAYERILLFSALDIDALGRELSRTVVAQEGAIRALCNEFSLYAAGTHNLNRPPSYLFVATNEAAGGTAELVDV